jgi:hypothetical protein
MKQSILLLSFILILLTASAQKNFEGTWKGVMVQDSPRVHINFEMVLQEKEGQITGYLYRLFIVNDSLIYNTVRVNARVADSLLIMEDQESVSRNFEERANRKIKATYVFKLNPDQPVADTLLGEWTTSRFKNKYMSVNGKVSIRREIFYETTQLFKRLEEKQLHTSIVFVPKRKAPDVAIQKPAGNIQPATPNTTTPKEETAAATEVTTLPKKDTVVNTIAVADPVKKDTAQANKGDLTTFKPNATAQTPAQPEKNLIKVTNENASASSGKPGLSSTKPPASNQNTTLVNSKPPAADKPSTTPAITKTTVTPPEEKPAQLLIRTDEATIKEPSLEKQQQITVTAPVVLTNPVIVKRETEIIQTLAVFEDSITLALYDNGEIDGDTVSVFLNNEQIISKIGLKATAYKHTIYVKKGETVQLSFFAENLGTIPPNSGLLIVYSGEQRYQVFFTSTLSKTAAVVLKRE